MINLICSREFIGGDIMLLAKFLLGHLHNIPLREQDHENSRIIN